MRIRMSFCFALALALTSGCAHNKIRGTDIADTPDNRAVLAVLEQLRQALENRDADALLSLVSPSYFEDMGTSNPEDDYGYTELRDHVAKISLDAAKEVFVNFELHEIMIEGGQAIADYRYDSRTRIELPTGKSMWDTHREFNRVELAKASDGRWLIVSGL